MHVKVSRKPNLNPGCDDEAYEDLVSSNRLEREAQFVTVRSTVRYSEQSECVQPVSAFTLNVVWFLGRVFEQGVAAFACDRTHVYAILK